MSEIVIIGAKENNLKNIDLTIPRNKIVCFVGVSGSGKSTIAFDIIAKEGQRQYFESLSSYARRYLQKSNRPLVDDIKGISSTIVINQERVHPNPRSTVGTVTETYTYLRLLFSRVGYPIYDSSYFSFNHPLGACPRCKGLGKAMDININNLVDMDKSLNEGAILYSNWKVESMWWKIIRATNYFDMDKKIKDYNSNELNQLLYADKKVLVDKSGMDNVINWTYKGVITHLLSRGTSKFRTVSTDELKYFKYIDCPECSGWRLKKSSLEVKINGLNIGEVGNLPIVHAIEWVKKVEHRNAEVIKPRIIEQFRFLIDAGVGYLSLNRSTDTLSGGEAQRIKLARQLGCDLIETIYVLDEPTAGLHPRDVDLVIRNLKRLRDNGNTVIVVEHDETVIKNADHIIEVGPGGGRNGGKIIFNGDIKDLKGNKNSITSKYLFGSDSPLTTHKREIVSYLDIDNICRHNINGLNVRIPLNVLTCLTGVSGAGKSSLVEEILGRYPEKIKMISQQPVGNNKRGCIGTYVGIFDEVRNIFAKENGVSTSLFSYNSKGACEECKGLGIIDMDMNFLGNVMIKCDKCKGHRYKSEILGYKYKNKNIVEVLSMTAIEALNVFKGNPIIERGLNFLMEVGLDYIEIGQSLDTLSGGENQRLKIASRLSNKGEFYILDEPTSGLHFADIEKLMKLLNRLVDNGNTVLVIEHNLDLIKKADWIIDMGPEGGDKGGKIVVEGTPEEVALCPFSHTGKYLRAKFEKC